MLRSGVFIVALVVVATDRRGASAAPCPPTVSLSGDDDGLVGALRVLLDQRGIASNESKDSASGCPAIRARVERRGDALAVALDRPGDPVERVVEEAATAATVLESWARTDIAAPLLASHPLPAEPPREAPPVAGHAERGLQLFAAAETSLGSDGTGWLGTQLGMCINFDPICLATRLHMSSVVAKSSSWAGLERKNIEILVGIDIPIAVGGATLSPGFAAGIGHMRTHQNNVRVGPRTGEWGGETGGLRADIHATLSIPFTRRFALDLSLTATLTQATHIEVFDPQGDPTMALALPDEPLALFRFAAGLRYGGL